MKCPVCKSDSGGYYQLDFDEVRRWVEMSLYQRSYPGEPEYISSRCLRCFDKAIKKNERKLDRKASLENIKMARSMLPIQKEAFNRRLSVRPSQSHHD